MAAHYGHVATIKLLVEAGANVNQQNEDGETPLHSSLMGLGGKAPCALIELGADVNIADNKGMTPLITAARIYFHLRDLQVVFFFTPKEIKNEEAGCIIRIRSLIKAGAHIGRRDRLGRLYISVAVHAFVTCMK